MYLVGCIRCDDFLTPRRGKLRQCACGNVAVRVLQGGKVVYRGKAAVVIEADARQLTQLIAQQPRAGKQPNRFLARMLPRGGTDRCSWDEAAFADAREISGGNGGPREAAVAATPIEV